MINYIKNSLARKRARRFFREYPYEVEKFHLERDGHIEFANWQNPLARKIILTQTEIDFWSQFIKKGSLTLDIGANIGDTTVPIAYATGKEGLTLAFEPNPHVFRILEVNASLNEQKTNIVPLPYAITSQDSEVFYNSSEASFANGGISQQKSKFHGKYSLKRKVKAINLGKFLDSEFQDWLPRLSMIKVDTEGHDLEILKSAFAIINSYKPAIIGEFFPKLSTNQRRELFDLVTGLGYKLFGFNDHPDPGQVFPITVENHQHKEIFNYYALYE